MSDEPSPYTEADVERVADALKSRCPLCRSTPNRCAGHPLDARAALRALAVAGRLFPEGAERAEEWTMRYRLNGKETCGEDAGHLFDSRAEAEAHIAAWRLHYPQLTYSDVVYLRRDVHVGPWQPIIEETEKP